jgi:hypothetical protein
MFPSFNGYTSVPREFDNNAALLFVITRELGTNRNSECFCKKCLWVRYTYDKNRAKILRERKGISCSGLPCLWWPVADVDSFVYVLYTAVSPYLVLRWRRAAAVGATHSGEIFLRPDVL